MIHKLRTAILVAAISFVYSSVARSGEPPTLNQNAIVTFNSPVETPGGVLPPGTYFMEVTAGDFNRYIVQIFDNRDELIVSADVIPAYRIDATDDTVVTFEERGGETPDALRRWFNPGKTRGVGFVYPHQTTLQPASDPPLSRPVATPAGEVCLAPPQPPAAGRPRYRSFAPMVVIVIPLLEPDDVEGRQDSERGSDAKSGSTSTARALLELDTGILPPPRSPPDSFAVVPIARAESQ